MGSARCSQRFRNLPGTPGPRASPSRCHGGVIVSVSPMDERP
ncbi:hypothetical protein HMPREF0551_1804 [Lautropia mirabilis ATCC 51599]|uniref:Uncharacterized protein n=1 Tax=Lautropia mirabilis ATCC 51599 TaxID=887898 RepID=E7RYP0_9BURK|nr:hypothetical protein HMPREF0551_1804 [Lautropia mirabilis ATCC 51599]